MISHWTLFKHKIKHDRGQALDENKKEGTDLFIVGMWYLVMGWEVEKQ